MKITEKFKINKMQGELDFVNIDIDKDMQLYIDPYRISKLSGPFIDKANGIINNFFSYIIELLLSKNYDKINEIFTNFSEVNETCLGLSKNKPRGNGLGNKGTQVFLESIKRSRAIELGIMESLEDIKVFIPGVGSDRISDMTTNIIRKLLIEYTQEQCKIFGIPLRSNVASGLYWDTNSRSWKQEYTDMLVIDNKRYLLVPKIIVTYGDRITSNDYFNHFVLDFLQNENIKKKSDLVQYRKGKKNKGEAFVTKKDISEKQLKIKKGNSIEKDWLANFTNAHARVFKQFKEESFSKMKDVDYDEKRDEIAKYLINKLKSIKPGSKDANEYHITMICILEFIFYPHISNPKKEVEINDGRKRIDIVFNNSSISGFFYDLFEKYDIPAHFIMVECKNYSSDLGNQELDQLLGRFSKHRGKFGISTSRKTKDYNALIKRCNDIYSDTDNLIIPLLDKDIISILEKISNGDENAGLDLLLSKYTEITFPK